MSFYFKENFLFTTNNRVTYWPYYYRMGESRLFLQSLRNKYTFTEYNCIKCGKVLKLNTFKCPECDHLQWSKIEQTYFQLFDIAQVYSIDEDKLKQKFRHLQSEYHPDKFGTRSEQERSLSEELSSFINKAYTTLNNPYERGVYLLKLYNIDMKESEKHQLDRKFLMEIMELNEELVEIRDAEELTKFETENDKKIKKISNDIAQAFFSEQFEKAKLELQRMKYFVSIRNRIKDLKTKL